MSNSIVYIQTLNLLQLSLDVMTQFVYSAMGGISPSQEASGCLKVVTVITMLKFDAFLVTDEVNCFSIVIGY